MKVTKEVSPITWKTMDAPDNFPCMICMERNATIEVVLSDDGGPFQHLVGCEPCSKLSASEVYDKIRTKKGGDVAEAME